jgi:hypothetical protein
VGKAADEFNALADEAGAGRLMLRNDAAQRCAVECDKYAQQLEKLRDRAQGNPGGRPLVYWEAFGPFTCSRDLGTKFRSVVDGPGDDSLAARLTERIEMVSAMARMFRKAGASYHDTDARTAHAAQNVNL